MDERPGDMNRVPLRFAAVLNRRVLPETTDPGLKFRYVDISAVDSTGRVALPDELMTFARAPSRARRLAPAGATAISTVRTYLRAIASVPESAVPLVLSTGFAVAEATSGYDPRFLYYACRSDGFVDEVVARSVGVSYPAISPTDLAAIPIPSPTLEAQWRIADFLDDQVARIDNIIAARRAQIALGAAARRAEVIRRLLAGGDLGGPASAAWYRNLPPSFPIRPLRAAWQVVDCKHRTPAYVAAGYPVVSPGDISPAPLDLSRCQRFVDEADYADLADALRRCRVGDVVYSRNASAGTAAFVATEEPFTMGQDVCRITSARRSQRYLYYVLNFAVAPQLEAVRVGSTFTRINIDEIKSLRVPLPQDTEQERISSGIDRIIDEFDAILATESQQITLLEKLKRTLITAAVTGEFDVSSADDSGVRV